MKFLELKDVIRLLRLEVARTSRWGSRWRRATLRLGASLICRLLSLAVGRVILGVNLQFVRKAFL